MIETALAFLKRDLLIAWSYRLKFLGQLGGIVCTTCVFFFLGKLISPQHVAQLSVYGGDYFAFSLIGLAFADYMLVSVNGFADEIRKGQVEGTFEALLASPVPPLTILFSSSLSSFLFTTLRVFLYLGLGVVFFDMRWHLESPLLFGLVFLLTVLSFWGIGLLSAAFVILFKQTSPINRVLGPLAGVLGGVMFPVQLLPHWLEGLARLLPITWALEALRKVLLGGADFGQVRLECWVLLLFAGIFLLCGIFAFRYGLRHAQKEGSLLHY
jgi:ABC-2 type transport system permease protein